MVGGAGAQGKNAVDLLDDEKQGDPVRKRETGQGPKDVRRFPGFLGKAVRAAENERDVSFGFPFRPRKNAAEILRRKILSRRIQDDFERVRREEGFDVVPRG